MVIAKRQDGRGNTDQGATNNVEAVVVEICISGARNVDGRCRRHEREDEEVRWRRSGCMFRVTRLVGRRYGAGVFLMEG